MNSINFIQTKKLKAVFFAFLLIFITGNTFAQQAVLSDYEAVWSGTGDDNQTYLLTLNNDNTATLKIGNVYNDVVGWKLSFMGGNILYDNHGHTVMRLISNVIINTPPSKQVTLPTSPGPAYKIYFADVLYDLPSNTMTMVVDFINPAYDSRAVTIVFTK